MTSALHNKADIVLLGKLHSFLNVVRFGSVDDIDWILCYVAGMK